MSAQGQGASTADEQRLGQGQAVDVYKVAITVADKDTADDRNGPSGRGCVHGTKVDAVPFDDRFECRCNVVDGTTYVQRAAPHKHPK